MAPATATFARVLAGEVPAWRARRIAHATRALSRDAAAVVDARVAGIVETLTPYRLERIVQAAVMDTNPDAAQAQADLQAGDRGVWVAQSRSPTPWARRWTRGPTLRRGMVATDAQSRAAHRPRGPPCTCTSPTRPCSPAPGVLRAGVLGAGELGPLLISQLSELVGHDRIVVKPVIDLADQISVDAYEVPDRIRERALLRRTHCAFPWCNRPATTRTDLDHVAPYDDTGPPGQTSTENLAPGCRLHHRVKTHGGWRCERLSDGAIGWTSPKGRRYRVDHSRTHPTTDT